MKSITWKIGGEAGFGIMTTGVTFSKIATRHGYYIFDYVEYPSLIRGGHNVYEVRMSDEEVFSQEYGIDVLIALNKDTVDKHKDEMKDNSIIVYDKDQFQIDQSEIKGKNVELYHLPLAQLVKQAGASKVMENNVALSASLSLLGIDIEPLFSLIEESFSKKGEEVVSLNKTVAQNGFDYVVQNKPKKFEQKFPKINNRKQLVVTGNEAIGMGALAGGCKLYIAYPMTPASSILHFMAKHGPDFDTVVKHAEDEISVINMAIGAGYTGARSMVATSGGGFSLMTEGLGLAAITESPVVIVVAMRPGPATGMPTWTGQGDLQYLIHASQDEFPRIILAPGDVAEAFYMTTHAFNLAEYYQTPVFVLSDKYLSEGHKSTPVFDTKKLTINRGKLLSWENGDKENQYLRYKITDDGLPWRALPGMKQALFVANSYEHNEYGWTTEDSQERIDQVDRRNRKMKLYTNSIPQPNVYGEKDADITLVAWGSSKGPILQAMKELKAEKYNKTINFLHINYVWPFPADYITDILTNAKKTLLVEGNASAQMGLVIRQQTGIDIENKYVRYDGRPFYPKDIKTKIQKIVGK